MRKNTMQLLNKLSAKDILGNVMDVVKDMEIDETKEAFAVAGICGAYETGVSTYGDWVRFVGDFQGINYLSGEPCRAPKAHIPDILEQVLLEGLKETAEIVAEKCTKTGKYFKLESDIEFSYKVSVKRLADKEDGGASYKYIVTPMTEVAANDKLSHLTALIEPPKEEVKEEKPKSKGKAKEKAA